MRFQATCTLCGDPLDIRAEGVFKLMTGWVKNRSQGGGNALALAEPVGRNYACKECIAKRQHGMHTAQASLF